MPTGVAQQSQERAETEVRSDQEQRASASAVFTGTEFPVNVMAAHRAALV